MKKRLRLLLACILIFGLSGASVYADDPVTPAGDESQEQTSQTDAEPDSGESSEKKSETTSETTTENNSEKASEGNPENPQKVGRASCYSAAHLVILSIRYASRCGAPSHS